MDPRASNLTSSAARVVVTAPGDGGEALRAETAMRLRAIATVGAILWGLVIGLDLLFWAFDIDMSGVMPRGRVRLLSISAVGVLLSVWTARTIYKDACNDPEHLTLAGLIFGVLTTLLMSLAQYGQLGVRNADYALPWAMVWVVLFPILVPARPRQALIAIAVASLEPVLALGFWSLVDGETASARGWILTTVAAVVAAGMAAVPHKILLHLRRHFADAERQLKRLGSYQLEERLGAGGMGEVWRARHRMLRRPAAVKLIRAGALGAGTADTDSEQAERRFEREAQVTAELQSPHTVRLFDFGRSASGEFYYVMELLDGLDLETLVGTHGPMDPERVVHLLLQACDSLEEAHLRGLIHRDIKPANLYACRIATKHDFIKILDFGLVTASRSGTLATGAGLTVDGAVSGTPAYMAPEMCLGDQPVDARADIYAVGCVAFWLLTGRLVFESENALRMMMAHVGEPPSAPSAASELPIPAELDALVLACLAKQPDERPASAAALREGLLAVPLEQAWCQDRAARWWELHSPTAT